MVRKKSRLRYSINVISTVFLLLQLTLLNPANVNSSVNGGNVTVSFRENSITLLYYS